jgi:hypothetical protein
MMPETNKTNRSEYKLIIYWNETHGRGLFIDARSVTKGYMQKDQASHQTAALRKRHTKPGQDPLQERYFFGEWACVTVCSCKNLLMACVGLTFGQNAKLFDSSGRQRG